MNSLRESFAWGAKGRRKLIFVKLLKNKEGTIKRPVRRRVNVTLEMNKMGFEDREFTK